MLPGRGDAHETTSDPGLASAALATLPWSAAAQTPPRVFRIGWLTAQRPPSLVPYVQAFRTSLAELGFAEGKNLTIEFRYGDDDRASVRALADELVRAAGRPDRRPGRGRARDQRSAKLPVPVVYAYSGDPVEPAWPKAWRGRTPA